MLWYIVLLFMVAVLGVGLAMIFNKITVPPEHKEKYLIGALTGGTLLGLLSFILPKPKTPDWLKRKPVNNTPAK
ncbi:MAG: hypothetical protein HZC05_03465 [Candidatus Magasanikbacteria bacterium]|nr:hypothetical protein [Candidatus Magasanikbacteria bacterium]